MTNIYLKIYIIQWQICTAVAKFEQQQYAVELAIRESGGTTWVARARDTRSSAAAARSPTHACIILMLLGSCVCKSV